MFSEQVTDKDGNVKTVYATTEEDLRTAVEQVKALEQPVSPDINKPVKQGHDLTEVDEAMNTRLVDGTGEGTKAEDAGGNTEEPSEVADEDEPKAQDDVKPSKKK